MRICSYKNCFNVQNTGNSISFFEAPKNDIKQIWIKHSGNTELYNSLLKTFYFCENHFFEKDLCRKIDRISLKKFAVPKSSINICKCSNDHKDETCATSKISKMSTKRKRNEEVAIASSLGLDYCPALFTDLPINDTKNTNSLLLSPPLKLNRQPGHKDYSKLRKLQIPSLMT